MAGDEPDIGAGSVAGEGGGFRRLGRAARRAVAGTIAAKVTTDGVRNLTREFSALHEVLKKVRGELEQINRQAGAGTGGGTTVGQGTATGAAGTQAAATGGGGIFGRVANIMGGGGAGWGGQGSPVRGPGGFNYGAAMVTGAAVLQGGANIIEDRFMRNVAQSAPISSRDIFTASMYGNQYRGMEMRRFNFSGQFGGTREAQQQAQQIALGFGATMAGSERFLQAAGTNVQATGGSMTIAQTASQVGLFASPMVTNRARVMGIMSYRDQGVLNDPMKVALDYVKDYEKRNNVTMNEMDFSNLRAPGSGHRMRMKMIYGLSDEAIDMVVNAGMQNMQFRTKAGRNINFGSSADLERIGMKASNVLGLEAAKFGTTAQRREARFFENQEGAMVGRLEMEEKIQNALSATEQAFGDLLGPLHEFQIVVKSLTTLLGVAGGIGMLTGGFGGGGGGGLLGMLRGLGGRGGAGAPGQIPGQMQLPGTTGPTGVAGMGTAARIGVGAAGVAGVGAGTYMAATADTPGGIALGIGAATASGALAGQMLIPIPGVGAGIGAGVGFGVSTTFAAINYFKGVDAKNVKSGYSEGVGMTDKALIDSIQDYVKNQKVGLKGEGAGAKQRGRFDAFARRRGSLLAAALDEAQSTGVFSDQTTQDATELGELVKFFGSDGVFNDGDLWSKRGRAEKYSAIVRSKGSKIWQKYFGSGVTDPFAYQPVNTDQSKGLIMSAEQSYQAAVSGEQTGDPMPGGLGGRRGLRPRDPFPGGGDAIEDKVNAQGETWSNLDNTMKQRLLALFRASGGRVWLGNGWRSEQQQREMFLSRYVPDPNGEIKNWEGQNWTRVSGAPAAPPGRSYHEIGLAADLEGDLGWMNAHAAEFQLIHFADVNDEPWHVQPAEIPRGRSEYQGGFGGGTGAGATAPAAAPAAFGGGGGSAVSGINYSMAAAAAAVSAPGMVGGGAAPAAGTGTPGAGWGGAWPGDMDAKGQAVAKVAANVGNFHGDLLYNMIAISKRESQWNPNALADDSDDLSYGLWQINMIGDMGPGRRQLFGIASNEELFDPNKNAKAARMIYDAQGIGAWSTASGVNPADVVEAQRLAQAANVGDPVSARGMSLVAPGVSGSANVNIDVTINSTGNVRYDAQALGDAVRPVLSNVMAEISTKRGS